MKLPDNWMTFSISMPKPACAVEGCGEPAVGHVWATLAAADKSKPMTAQLGDGRVYACEEILLKQALCRTHGLANRTLVWTSRLGRIRTTLANWWRWLNCDLSA